MNNVSYIGERPSQDNMHAGSKARVDIDILLETMGFHKELNLENSKRQGTYNRIRYEINKLMTIIKISSIKNRILIMQYPYYISKMLMNKLYKKTLDNKVVLVVHDIESIRDGGNVSKEVNFLNQAHLLIIHNQDMLNKLLCIGVKTPMICIELFDYLLYKGVPLQNYDLGNKVVFAGNLGKSNFLKDPQCGNLKIEFCLYGPNFDAETMLHQNITYCGSFYPEEIPYNLKGSFGLVWDGDTVGECSGLMGEYTRYNNPHKLSMYIAAGLPVIVWKEAAIANFVEKNKIGFTVNDLQDIEREIKELTTEDYEEYLMNIRELQKKVCSGYYTSKALKHII